MLIRGEQKAWWSPTLPDSEWNRAVAIHEDQGKWRFHQRIPREWKLSYQDLTWFARMTDTSKHLGIFPEQSPHWHWICKQARPAARLLNLFGYTGAASLVAAQAGFHVTHVDASKPAIAWARDNQHASRLQDKPIRWIVDDALKYVQREARRGSRYDALLLDPPSFGRGPNGEVWKVEHMLTELLSACRRILVDNPLFIILTMYNIEASSLMLGNMLTDAMADRKGLVTVGELALPHTHSPHLLPLSIYARWAHKH
jgi:23S rRNA (cytosine1962-C5)-methyltransferase